MNRTLRILFTGGGSGGHVYPLLAVAGALTKIANENNLQLEFHYLGPFDQYSALLSGAGVRTHPLIYGKLRRYFSILNFLDIPKFFIGLLQAFAKMFLLMPDAVFSKGGPGAFPVIVASWFYRIPILLHESDAAPGLANLLSAPFAKRIAVGFEKTLAYFSPRKVAWTGNPVRPELLSDRMDADAAKQALNFNVGQPLTLILGGSQGSQRINEFIVTNLAAIIKETQLFHQAGSANYHDVQRLSRAALIDVPLATELKSRYQTVPYLGEELKTALAAADLVVARPGAGVLSEIAAFAKPAILIPIPESANDHQRANAYEFAKSGAAVVIEETNLLAGIFLNQIRTILGDGGLSGKMSASAGKFFKLNAAEVIAEELLKISLKQ